MEGIGDGVVVLEGWGIGRRRGCAAVHSRIRTRTSVVVREVRVRILATTSRWGMGRLGGFGMGFVATIMFGDVKGAGG